MKKICILLFLAGLISCNSEKKAYYKEFKRYMSEIHNIDCAGIEDTYFLPIPVSGCTSCVNTPHKRLHKIDKSLQDKFVLIIVGQTYDWMDEDIKAKIAELKEHFTYIEDPGQTIFNYQVNFGYPLLVHIKKGKNRVYEELHNNSIATVFDKLD